MIERRNIYSNCINDIALEISLSSIWRKQIFDLDKNEILQLSSKDKDIIPEYIRDIILDNDLRFYIQIVDSCEEQFDEGLVIFRFCSAEFSEIAAYSGNNPEIQ